MVILYYEAYDGDVCIYNGTSKSAAIMELFDYVYYQNHINIADIQAEDIQNLNEKALKEIGIDLYISKGVKSCEN